MPAARNMVKGKDNNKEKDPFSAKCRNPAQGEQLDQKRFWELLS